MLNSRKSGLLKQDPHFDGSDYDEKLDKNRLTGQILRIYDTIKDQKWRTLAEIEGSTGDPQASVSAQLRNLRKSRFGGHVIEKRRVSSINGTGTWQYRLLINDEIKNVELDNKRDTL